MPPRKLLHLPRSLLPIRPVSYLRLHPRPFSSTLPPRERSSEGGSANPQKAAQNDREKINTEANEYAKSGTDDSAAKNEEAAFDPNITSPEGAKQKAGEGNEENPLDVSPANQNVSQGTRENDGGAGKKGNM